MITITTQREPISIQGYSNILDTQTIRVPEVDSRKAREIGPIGVRREVFLALLADPVYDSASLVAYKVTSLTANWKPNISIET